MSPSKDMLVLVSEHMQKGIECKPWIITLFGNRVLEDAIN